ncbi:hypothetical protein QTP86_012694, partial [Hemibagrus guttatus]
MVYTAAEISAFLKNTKGKRLACIDPPPKLLADLQAMMLDFFWDKLHWLPQSILYLPKEESGQGLIHLSSRTGGFCLCFVQKLLTGPENLSWRAAANGILHTVGGWGLD